MVLFHLVRLTMPKLPVVSIETLEASAKEIEDAAAKGQDTINELYQKRFSVIREENPIVAQHIKMMVEMYPNAGDQIFAAMINQYTTLKMEAEKP